MARSSRVSSGPLDAPVDHSPSGGLVIPQMSHLPYAQIVRRPRDYGAVIATVNVVTSSASTARASCTSVRAPLTSARPGTPATTTVTSWPKQAEEMSVTAILLTAAALAGSSTKEASTPSGSHDVPVAAADGAGGPVPVPVPGTAPAARTGIPSARTAARVPVVLRVKGRIRHPSAATGTTVSPLDSSVGTTESYISITQD